MYCDEYLFLPLPTLANLLSELLPVHPGYQRHLFQRVTGVILSNWLLLLAEPTAVTTSSVGAELATEFDIMPLLSG
jgi:hypothetical protein